MKSIRILKSTAALLLVLTVLCGLCACRSKEVTEAATNAVVTVAAVFESTEEAAAQPELTTQPEPTTLAEPTALAEETATEPIPTTARPTTAVKPTAASQRPAPTTAAEPAEINGVETLRDGGKTVVYPSALKNSAKRWPVIAWANGTGCPTWSYTALLQALAEGGYIVVADESVMTADGTDQIDSIDYILRQNSDKTSPFYQKIDAESLGVCGHSQGGRSCVNAAQADRRIRCVVSIAGSSYVKEARGLSAPCLFLTGTNDLIVVSSQWCKPAYNAVAGRAAYASLKGGIHTTCMTNPEKVSGYILSWFDAYLKNDLSAKKVFAPDGRLARDPAWQDFQSKN